MAVKILPGNLAAEEQILAGIFMYPRLIMQCADRLKPAHFATPDLANVYECMVELLAIRREPTVFNVSAELLKKNMRTDDLKQVRYDLNRIKESFSPDGDFEDYVWDVYETSKHRRLIQYAQAVAQLGYSQTPGAVQKAQELLSAIALESNTDAFSTFAEALDDYWPTYEQARQDHSEGRVTGLSTGFKTIDRFFRFFPGDLDILAARTSIGKTSWALNVALHTAKEALQGGVEVAFFSLEMSKRQLVQRLLSTDALINQTLLRDGRTDEAQHDLLVLKRDELRPIGLHIADTTRELDDIKSNSRSICKKRKIGLIIVDYIQLVRHSNSSNPRQPRHEMVAEISRELKALAQELQVPILALAQLNRESEKQDEPQITNLGESDAIGRDADSVSFIHVTEEEMKKRNLAQDYNVAFKVRKNRQGPLGEVALGFRPGQTRFVDLWEE